MWGFFFVNVKKLKMDLYNLFEQCNYNYSTDSRKISEGCLYIPLKGANFNGNDFVIKAIHMGAAYALTENIELVDNVKVFFVHDGLEALQDIARIHIQKLKPKTIAITGSNGKTTTKELIHSIFSNFTKDVIATEGNLNNHIGVPVTILRLRPHHKFAIIEMGANHQGEIKSLCEIANPDFGVITSIGKAHLEGFGGEEGVIKAKMELFDFLQYHKGVCFYNLNDATIASMYFDDSRNICIGNDSSQYKGVYSQLVPDLKFKLLFGADSIEIESPLFGIHNFYNALLAASIAQYFEIPNELIQKGIKEYIPKNMRSEFLQRGESTILLDAYNANPSSMRLAIESFSQMEGESKYLVLGGMAELGKYERDEHNSLIQFVQDLGFQDKVIVVGPQFKECNVPKSFLYFMSVDDMMSWFDTNIENKSVSVLIKGSRSIQLEKLIYRSI